MTIKAGQKKRQLERLKNYQSFEQLDGRHPWMSIVPEGYVAYRARVLPHGQVSYFNFALAKEMGLIPPGHEHALNPELEKKILDTFCLQIINEYDEINNRRIDPATIKPNKYMASRYLQLQHASRSGKTSGDGRGIWNGTVEHQGQCWDVSSRGTGVTRLAPGAVEAQEPLRTGETTYGYGCGQAEIDELFAAAIFAELMHLQGIHTERVLCVIDLGRGLGIGVRAAPCLLRPAHFFLLLKQSRLEDLRRATDFFLERQSQNKRWRIPPRGKHRYDQMLRQVALDFARFAARLEVDYIFAWLDWDGDNVLADAGIIDYGSIRQFGIRHDHYRYDDVDRFSTNLNEQRFKARLIVQVFAQMTNYLKTGTKKPLKNFGHHPALRFFDQEFEAERKDRLLYRAGFTPAQRRKIVGKKRLFQRFDRAFSRLEKAKVKGRMRPVADGVNHPALFDLRSFLREYPCILLERGLNETMSARDLFDLMLSEFGKRSRPDRRLRRTQAPWFRELQKSYLEILSVAAGGRKKIPNILPEVAERAQILNREDRMTGNALIEIVDDLMKYRKRDNAHREMVQNLIDQMIGDHLNCPEVPQGRFFASGPRRLVSPDLLHRITEHLHIHRHDI